jgi:phosphotransferase system HPr (HPr) family protein
MDEANLDRPAQGVSSPTTVSERIKITLNETTRNVTVPNSLGLHMRPVMRLVDLANQFQSRITIGKGKTVVDGKNPMELMLLEATRDSELEVRAVGPDADAAVEAICELIDSGFGEE